MQRRAVRCGHWAGTQAGGWRTGLGSCPACLPQVEYFNNATIVDLVERPHRGILAVLDEACSTAGPITDRIFLQTLDTHHRHHPHYTSRQVPLCPCGLPTLCPSSWSRHWRAPHGATLPVLGWVGGLGGGSASSAGLSPLSPLDPPTPSRS